GRLRVLLTQSACPGVERAHSRCHAVDHSGLSRACSAADAVIPRRDTAGNAAAEWAVFLQRSWHLTCYYRDRAAKARNRRRGPALSTSLRAFCAQSTRAERSPPAHSASRRATGAPA